VNIPVSVVYDEAGMGAGQKWHWRKQGRVRWFWPVLGVLSIAFAVRAVTEPNALAPGIMCFIFGTHFLLLPWIQGIQHRRNIRKSPYYRKTVAWQIDEHQISAVTEGATWSVTWDKIRESRQRPRGSWFILRRICTIGSPKRPSVPSRSMKM